MPQANEITRTVTKDSLLEMVDRMVKDLSDQNLITVHTILNNAENADPKFIRMLRGTYFLNDMFNMIKREYVRR